MKSKSNTDLAVAKILKTVFPGEAKFGSTLAIVSYIQCVKKFAGIIAKHCPFANAEFVPDDKGGHMLFDNKTWRPTD